MMIGVHVDAIRTHGVERKVADLSVAHGRKTSELGVCESIVGYETKRDLLLARKNANQKRGEAIIKKIRAILNKRSETLTASLSERR